MASNPEIQAIRTLYSQYSLSYYGHQNLFGERILSATQILSRTVYARRIEDFLQTIQQLIQHKTVFAVQPTLSSLDIIKTRNKLDRMRKSEFELACQLSGVVSLDNLIHYGDEDGLKEALNQIKEQAGLDMEDKSRIDQLLNCNWCLGLTADIKPKVYRNTLQGLMYPEQLTKLSISINQINNEDTRGMVEQLMKYKWKTAITSENKSEINKRLLKNTLESFVLCGDEGSIKCLFESSSPLTLFCDGDKDNLMQYAVTRSASDAVLGALLDGLFPSAETNHERRSQIQRMCTDISLKNAISCRDQESTKKYVSQLQGRGTSQYIIFAININSCPKIIEALLDNWKPNSDAPEVQDVLKNAIHKDEDIAMQILTVKWKLFESQTQQVSGTYIRLAIKQKRSLELVQTLFEQLQYRIEDSWYEKILMRCTLSFNKTTISAQVFQYVEKKLGSNIPSVITQCFGYSFFAEASSLGDGSNPNLNGKDPDGDIPSLGKR